jgi:hypothetical protein
MEDQPLWHGSVKLTDEQIQSALAELSASADDVKELIDGGR